MLAGALIQDVEIMILDESTNFLDLLSIIWLQEHLITLRSNVAKTVLVVSHDRDIMDNICEELILLRDQKLSYFRGNISAYDKDFRSRVLYLNRMQEAQDREASRLAKTIRANIKVGKKTRDDNKLRMAKSRQKKMEERASMQVSATGGRFRLSRDRAGKVTVIS
jgi:ATPase subunit of ABC transporter with duplicated ATPase domains